MGDVDLRATVRAIPIVRDLVRVHGPEAVGFLQGQLSQDVEALEPGASARSFLLQPTGKVDAWLRVTRVADDELVLDVDAGFGEAVEARLRRFKLRTKAELDLTTRDGWAVRGPGAAGIGWPAGWPGVDGGDVLGDGGPLPEGVDLGEPAALEALRIECGVPAMGAELTEATIPAEMGQWLIDASVSFTKGCYTGQELVARIDSRGGNVPRPLRGLVVEGAAVPVGSAVSADGVPVGAVTSCGRSVALGTVALAVLLRSVPLGAVVQLEGAEGRVGAATVTALPMR